MRGYLRKRTLDCPPDTMVTSLIPALSCRPNAPFAELLKLATSSVADELNVSRIRTAIGE